MRHADRYGAFYLSGASTQAAGPQWVVLQSHVRGLPKIFPSAIACLVAAATLSWLGRVADMPFASNPPGGTYFSAGIDAASVQD